MSDWPWRNPYGLRAADEMAVERCLGGNPPEHLSPADRHAAIVAMTRRGDTARRIADVLRCTTRTVERARQLERAAA